MNRTHHTTRWLRLRAAHALLLAGVATPVLAHAQNAVTVPALTDADAPRLVAVLRADLARRSAVEERGRDVAREAGRAFQAKVDDAATPDPRAFVRSRTTHFIVPPDARYDEVCSVALSRGTLKPRAVYAIGKPATEVEDTLRKKDLDKLTSKDVWGLMMAQGNSTAGKAFASAMQFYQTRGFKLQGPVDAAAFLAWGDGSKDPLGVAVYPTNVGAGNGLAECARLGNVALLTLEIRDEGPTVAQRAQSTPAAAASVSAEDGYAAALKRAGLDEARYSDLLMAAVEARGFAEEPAMLDAFDEIAAKENNVSEQRANAVRRRNTAWYKRHAAELGPLLAQWKQS